LSDGFALGVTCLSILGAVASLSMDELVTVMGVYLIGQGVTPELCVTPSIKGDKGFDKW